MKLEVYGHTEETLMAGDWGNKHGKRLGIYDGIEFKSSNYEIEDLKEWDYIQIFIKGDLIVHWPKKFNENILDKLKKLYIFTFGEVQQIRFM